MEDVLNEGKDLENFLWEMIKHTKDILMYKVSKRKEIYNGEELKQIEETANKTSKEELINIIYKLSELENKMKTSSQKTIIFETGIIKLCVKIDDTEETKTVCKEPKPVRMAKTNTIESDTVRQQPKVAPIEKNEGTRVPEAVCQELQPGEKITNWQSVINNIKKQGKVMLYANLIGTDAVEINDMTVEIRFYNGLNDFRKDLIQKNENMNVLVKEVSVICGKPMQIKLKDASGEKQTQKSALEPKPMQLSNDTTSESVTDLAPETSNTLDNAFEDLGIEINFIDEE